MSLATIREVSREQGVRAAEREMRPYVFATVDEIDDCPPFPNIGDYEPPGWEEVDRLFCDKSGMGADYAPAMTIDQLKRKLKQLVEARGNNTLGFAIVQEGQLQVYVGVFRKVTK